MRRYVAVFRSRTDVMSFIEDMRKKSAYSKAVSTPKEAKVGCGISAEISYAGLVVAKKLINTNKYSSFYALLFIDNKVVKRI